MPTTYSDAFWRVGATARTYFLLSLGEVIHFFELHQFTLTRAPNDEVAPLQLIDIATKHIDDSVLGSFFDLVGLCEHTKTSFAVGIRFACQRADLLVLSDGSDKNGR